MLLGSFQGKKSLSLSSMSTIHDKIFFTMMLCSFRLLLMVCMRGTVFCQYYLFCHFLFSHVYVLYVVHDQISSGTEWICLVLAADEKNTEGYMFCTVLFVF